MSGVLKALGKVFISPISAVIGGKVGKIIRKVAIGAIAVGAVVLTGGAALGVLPSLGTVVGGLGLSAGLSAALTGAISSGAVGAVGGLLTGGFKGMEKGLLMGAATGGVLGGIGVLGPNGLIGGGKVASTLASSTGSGAISTGATSLGFQGVPSVASLVQDVPTISAAAGSAGAAAAPALSGAAAAAPSVGAAPLAFQGVPSVAGMAAPATSVSTAGTAAGGLFGGGGSFFSNPMNTMIAGQALSGLFTPSQSKETTKELAAQEAEKEKAAMFTYGDVYSKGGTSTFGTGTYGAPNVAAQPIKRYAWNPQTMTVEEVATTK